jgi:Ca-activated chloride channel family protein
MFEFAWPFAFLLLPLPFLLRKFRKNHQVATVRTTALYHNPMVQSGNISQPARFSVWPWLLWLCLCVALAHPKYYGEPIQLPNEGREIMLAVDLSTSMREQDMQYQGQYIDRLSVVKAVLNEFITARTGDRLGLILFADTAFLQTPLTRDLTTVAKMLDEAQIGLVGQATAIGDALGLAVKRFALKDDSNRILILLTDGQNTAGNLAPDEALILAKDAGIKVYTVGVGADSQSNFFGFQMQRGSALDESLLTDIARETGGQYFRATDVASLQRIYQMLDQLEPISDNSETVRPQTALFYIPLFIAVLLLFLQTLVNSFKTLLSRRGA